MTPLTPKPSYRRGYAVAIIIGLSENSAGLWHIYSEVAKPMVTLRLEGNRNNVKAAYNFHEDIVNALRPTLNQGVRSLILVSPPRTVYAQELIEHVRRHHAWLTQGRNKVTFVEMTGSAVTRAEVYALTKNSIFNKIIQDATVQETENLLDLLENRLSDSSGAYDILFSLAEVEKAILCYQKHGPVPELLLLTNDYLSASRQKGRLNRVMQVAENRKVRTRVVDAETPAGKRLTQLGGIVCITKQE